MYATDYVERLMMDSLIRRASELHSASGVARSVLELSQREDFVVEELVSCVEMDPALTARILATVNSARFGLTRQVSNVQQAVTLLGRRTLRTIALSFSVIDAFTQGVNAKVYTDYWRRSLTTSLVADLLSQSVPDMEANDAYTAGLLADIGVLVLAQFESDAYLPVYEQNPHGPALIKAERATFGFDHAEFGSRLLEVWQFPPMFALAIAAHHDEQEAARMTLSQVVRAGNLMPGAIWIAESSAFHTAFSWFEKYFDFDIERFIDLAVEVNQAVAEEAEMYQVEGVEAVDCEMLQQEARRLLEEASELQEQTE